MVEKTLTISGKEVKFKASAAVPRLYRTLFHRDVFKDMTKLEKAVQKQLPKKGEAAEIEPQFEVDDLEIFENLAFAMAYHADHSIPKDINDWLDQFDMFSIYQILPEIFVLWGANLETEIESKKNLAKVSGR